jgi:uroporphyrinogen-III synthase
LLLLLLLLLLSPQALGKVMGSELPHIPGGSDVVLYPASVKASTDLQDSLGAAGFKVNRINTYNTVRDSSSPFPPPHCFANSSCSR